MAGCGCLGTKNGDNSDQSKSKEVKILLLGSPGSGKSTLVKQLRIIYGPGHTPQEILQHRTFIALNLCFVMQKIVGAMPKLQIPYTIETNKENGEKLLNLNSTHFEKYRNASLNIVKNLWTDLGIRKCFQQMDSQFPDSTAYFLDHIDRISSPDYVMSVQDFIRINIPRLPTIGVVETFLDEIPFRIIEWGGQKINWQVMHCFEDVTSILFMVSLTDYDLLSESGQENKMEESMHFFKNALSCPWLKKSTVILLLNKKDLFEQKIQTSPLTSHFPDYDGPHGNHSSREFILKKFVDLNCDMDKIIYSHFISVTHTSHLRFIFTAVKDSILQRNVKHSELT